MDLVDAPRVFKHPFPTATQIQQSLLHLGTYIDIISAEYYNELRDGLMMLIPMLYIEHPSRDTWVL
jgi:hypothetical protein